MPVSASAAAMGTTANGVRPSGVSPAATTLCPVRHTVFYMLGAEGATTTETHWQCAFVHAYGIPDHAASAKEFIFDNFHQKTVDKEICLTDVGYVGDYFWIYASFDGYPWYLAGSTGQVATGSELTASSYNAHWTGTGTTFSTGCVTVTLGPYQYVYFGIVDALLLHMAADLKGPCGESALTLLTVGCTATGISVSKGWSPGGLEIHWYTF